MEPTAEFDRNRAATAPPDSQIPNHGTVIPNCQSATSSFLVNTRALWVVMACPTLVQKPSTSVVVRDAIGVWDVRGCGLR